ncbi:A-type potassium channel modulatory protein DPP6-like [Watersipora subatra]|uniref:A-type potassium channel modulatory protein DPP6-like n=1 Tax=Watersipora subatra TaxID=2589382 RepID=UPI00355B006B
MAPFYGEGSPWIQMPKGISGQVSPDRYLRTGISGQESSDRYLRTGISGQVSPDRYLRTGISGQVSPDRRQPKLILQQTFSEQLLFLKVKVKIKMHSFMSSASSASYLHPRRSRSGSILAYSQRRLSRASVEQIRRPSTSHSMAAVVMASNLNQQVLEGENGDRNRIVEYDDPVLARTLTVDESFRKMEELVGSEEESKNWKGIVISLVVITFILSMIALSIALITPGKENIEPGDPFTLSLLIDPSLNPQSPIFHVSSDGSSYITVRGSKDQREVVRVSLSERDNSQTSLKVLLPSSLFLTELNHLQDVTLSPDESCLLLQIQSESESEPTPSYRLYNLVSESSTMLYILGTEPLMWLSPDSSKLLYAIIFPQPSGESTTLSSLTLYVAGENFSKEPAELNFSSMDSNTSYMVGVRWLMNDQVMVAWLNAEQTAATYMLCDSSTLNCSQNLEYSNDDLNWVDVYQMPVLGDDGNYLYTILPDPIKRERYYHHLARFKLNKKRRTEPQVTFLTDYDWSDHKIVDVIGNSILYTSTGPNYTQRHLFSYNITAGHQSCLTCSIDIGLQCHYADATPTSSRKWVMLACLGPDLPSYYLVSMERLLRGGKLSLKNDLGSSQRRVIAEAMQNVKFPKIEYIRVALDSGYDALVKLYLPPELNRNKTKVYGLLLIIREKFGQQISTQHYPDPLTTYLCKNQSLIIAEADLRGSTGRGGVIEQAIYGGLGLKESHDVMQMISYLENNPKFENKIKRSKMAVMGKGYGGFVALHSIQKGIVPCAIAISPVTDLRSLSQFTKQRYMGNDDAILLATELKYKCKPGERCTVPRTQDLLLIHGTSDDVIPYDTSLHLMRKLQLAGYEFKQQIYPEVGHNLEKSSIQTHYYMTMTSYLTQCFNKTSKS